MSVSASPFCEHKKLRLTCALCKPAALPPPAKNATHFVSQDERAEIEEKQRVKEQKRAASVASGEPEKRATGTPGGPGKPLMPKKKVKKHATAAEAEQATAWWVKK